MLALVVKILPQSKYQIKYAQTVKKQKPKKDREKSKAKRSTYINISNLVEAKEKKIAKIL